MQKIKVLACNLTPRMGMLHYSSQFCNELNRKEDIDLRVAIADYYQGDLYDMDIPKLKIKTDPNVGSFLWQSMNILAHISFFRKVNKFQPDIIHILDNHPWYIPYIWYWKRKGIKIYTTQHDPLLHVGENTTLLGRVATRVNRFLAKNSDRLIVHGDGLKKQVQGMYGLSDKKVLSIPHGAFTFFSHYKKNLAVRRDTFLFFGRILEYKGLGILLKSFKSVLQKYPQSILIIAGPGDMSPYRKEVDEMKENLEIHNREIEAEEAYEFFEVSEFVVLPYIEATGSGVIPAAYSFSKAVITSRVGELAEHVIEGQTGSIVPPNNDIALSEEIMSFLKEKELVIGMGKRGKEYSLRALSWEPIVDKIYG